MTKNQIKEAAKILAKAGGLAARKKLGRKHYVKMAKKSWANRKPKSKASNYPPGVNLNSIGVE